MKKSLLAVAVLGAFAGAASAQSSVTLSGTVDANLQYIKNGDVKYKNMGTSGLNSSQLVFSGREDLGSGLYAGFVLNSGINNDTGTANSKFWNRRSTVSLGGNFGEIRLGRDYTPTFNGFSNFDPFGTNGVGDMEHVMVANNASPFALAGGVPSTATYTGQAGTNNATAVRADNAVQYFLPSNIGGVYGNAMVAAGEGLTNNRYEGGQIGWKGGPLNVSFAYGQTHLLTKDDKLKQYDLGATYDLGFAKFVAQYVRLKSDVTVVGGEGTNNVYQVGAVVPVGVGEIHASYTQNKGKDALEDRGAKMGAIGYVYNLSKRTALYGTYSYLKNDDLGNFAVGGTVTGGNGFGFKSQGAEFGLRHFF